MTRPNRKMSASLAESAESNDHDRRPNKKVKLDDPPPPYGSQEYWEKRYKQHQRDDGSQPAVGDGAPYHAWYFSYADLRPLILPLLLGGKNTEEIYDDSMHGVSDKSKETNSGDIKDVSFASDTTARDNDESNIDAIAEELGSHEGEVYHDDSDADENEEDQGSVFVEVHDGDLDDGDDDNDDESQQRDGVAKDGPVSVLEVGCGDVPLGKDLAIELMSMEKIGAANVDSVIKRIVCCDFSSTVIRILTEQKQKLGSKGFDPVGLAKLDSILCYESADARNMPQYADKSFEIVLEKGTLDAMLSDKDHGISNCQKIIAEMARVLTIGGYLVIVSHLNANTRNGLEWLEEIVKPGLQRGGDDARWTVEIHGNDGLDDTEDSSCFQTSTPGPCVYIIQKLNTLADDGDSQKASIELRFFSY